MSKKVTQTLTGAMAAMMATGVVATPVMAATKTQADILYRAAYEATIKVEKDKTQTSINEARAAIKALKEYAPKLTSAIGTFSSKVDAVQGPLLRNILKLIDTAKAEPTQANINAAKKAISADLPATWKNPYSSAVDKVQVALQAKVKAAVVLAETSKKVENIEAAKKLVADLATADSQAFKDYAKTMQTRVEAIKLYDLEVTKATISATGVSVVFKGLEEAVKDATVEVVDNNGKLVEVVTKTTTLIEGETETSFLFKSRYTGDLEGIWTVNGLKINLDHVNLIKEAKTLAAKNEGQGNAQNLFDLLEESGLVNNLVDSLVAHKLYHASLAAAYEAEKISTVEDIQKVIDATNVEMGTDVKAYDIVKVADSGTLSQFKEILNKSGLKRINEEFYTVYKTKFATNIDDKATTLSDLQDLIDDANDDFITDLFDGNAVKSGTGIAMLKNKDEVLDASLVAKYIGYVQEYIVLDKTADNYKDLLEDKEEKIYNLEVLLAITDIISADTQTSLKSALKKYETAIANEDKFDYETKVNENILYYLLKEVKVKDTAVNTDVLSLKKTLTSTGNVDTLITRLNALALKQGITELSRTATVIMDKTPTTVTTAEKTEFINALKNLEKVTVLNKDVVKGKVTETYNKFLYSYVDESILYEIALELKTGGNPNASGFTDNILSSEGTVDLVVRNISLVKASQVNTIIQDATVKTVVSKLEKIGVSNIVADNAGLYLNTEFKLTSKLTKADIQKVVNTVNAINTINNSTVVTEVRDAITTVGINESTVVDYINYSNAEKLDVAELLISDRDNNGTDFTEVGDKQTIVGNIVSGTATARTKVQNILNVVNRVTKDENKTEGQEAPATTVATPGELSTEFAKVSSEFYALNSAQRINVAVEFNAYRPKVVNDEGKVTSENAKIYNLSVVRDAINKAIKALGY